MFDSLLSAKEHFTEDTNNCEFAALVVLCSANEKLRRLCVSQKKKLEKFNKIFPIENIDDFRGLFNQYSKASQQYYRQNFDDNMQLLQSFVNNTTDLLSRLKSEVIQILQKDCEILELPEMIVDSFRELNESIEKDANASSQIYMQQQQDLKKTLDTTKTQLESTKFQKNHAEKQNRKLLAKVNELSEKNKVLQSQLDDALQANNKSESTYASVKDLTADHEETIRSLTYQRDKLQETLEHNQKNSQARCDALVAAEREIHIREMQRTQQMFEEEKKHLTEEMEKREQRYKQQKKKDKDMIDFLSKSVKEAQQSNSSAYSSAANSVKNYNNDELDTEDEDFVDNLIKELKRCIQASSWSKQKIIIAVRKIVDKLIKSSTEEQWRLWAISVLQLEDKSTKSSAVRKQIEQSISKVKNTEFKNDILLSEKKALLKFTNDKFNRDNPDFYSMAGIGRAILFIAIAKKIMATKMKPRKSYV